jgi:hypothetical protein
MTDSELPTGPAGAPAGSGARAAKCVDEVSGPTASAASPATSPWSPGPECPTCGQGLSWEAPGRYACDICIAAHEKGISIEEQRLAVEEYAREMAPFGALLCRESYDQPIKLPFDWSPINEEQRAWEREAVR